MKDANADTNVQIMLCDTIIVTMNEYWDLYDDSVPDVFKFMLHCTKSKDEQLAMEAVEFWPYYVVDPNKDKLVFQDYLSDLCPVLLQRMRYTPALLELIDWEKDDCSKAPDKEEDVMPLHYQSRTENQSRTEKSDSILEQDADDDETKWNIRKGAAGALDCITRCQELTQPLLKQIGPLIVNFLGSSDYLFVYFVRKQHTKQTSNKEAGLLAVGALCATGYELITPQLPKMVPYMLMQMKDENILVCSIACWAISRVSLWFDTED
ncbi:hypothetical protein RFI_16410, partial [Reticulomyxa filosa]